MKDYCVFDLETSGLDSRSCSILELAVIVVENNEVKYADSKLVNARVEVIEEVERITGITQDMVNGGEPLLEVLDWFQKTTTDQMLVGHNIFKFDHLVLWNECRRFGHSLASKLPQGRLRDTAAFYKGLKLGTKPYEGESHARYAYRVLNTRKKGLKFNLKAACEDLEIKVEDIKFHSGLGDVTATQRLYERLRIEIDD